MTQTETKNTYTIGEKGLFEEILIAVDGCFDCKIVRSRECALLHFANGQKFKLSLEIIE